MNSLEEKKLRQRFVSDFNLPIQVLASPYFEDRLNLFEDDFKAETKYKSLLLLIDKKYNGSINKFLEEYSKIRDKIITTVYNTNAFKNFNECNMSQYKINTTVGNTKLYTETNVCEDDNFYVSFDLKKANFQALKYVNPEIVFNAENYEDFIGKFTDSDYIKKSKYTRQVIFGKMNPRRTMTVEKYLINKLYDFLKLNFEKWGEALSINSDEIIFKLNKKYFDEFSADAIEHLEKTIKNEMNLDIRITKFRLHLHQFNFSTSDAKLDVYEKDCFYPIKRELMCVPATYAPQVYKLVKGKKITGSDLIFYYEHQLVKFLNPISINEKIEEEINNERYDELPF